MLFKHHIKPALLDHFGKKGIITQLVARLGLVMLLFSVSRVIFYLYNSSLFPEMNFPKFMYLLFGGLKFDLSATLYINALYILFFILPHPLRYNIAAKKVMKLVFFITNGIGLILNCYDMTFYPFTLRRTTTRIFKEFQNETNFIGILAKGILEHWVIVLVFIGLIILMVKLYRKPVDTRPKSNLLAHYVIGLLLAPLLAYGVVGGTRGGFKHSTRPITLSNAGKYVEYPREMSIVLNTPFAIIRTIGKATFTEKNYFDNNEELTQLFNPYHQAPADSASFKYDNVVIFIIESFGREFIGTLNPELDGGNYEGYTPFTDSLLTKSKLFWNSFANGKKSIDAMPSVLTSIPSIKTPYVLSHYSGNKVDGLASLLKRKGYQTGFFHGAPNGSMGFLSFSRLAGFDAYYGKDEYDNDEDFDGIWGIWDDKFFNYYANTLNEMKPPFMGALFSVSSHHPYKIPETYEGKLKQGPSPLHQCINFTDNALKQFFETASKMPWFENTLFVITADHTPSHPGYKHYRTAAGQFRVPIIFYHPQHPEWAEKDSEELIQQIDIMPSVLGYLNYDEPYFSFGRNVFDTLSSPYVINYQNNSYQYFSNDYLLQFDDNQNKTVGLYNFKQDSLLKHNLKGQLEVQANMEDHVKAFIQQYNYSIINNKTQVIPDSIQ